MKYDFGELVEGLLVEHAVQYNTCHRHLLTLRLLSATLLPLCTDFVAAIRASGTLGFRPACPAAPAVPESGLPRPIPYLRVG